MRQILQSLQTLEPRKRKWKSSYFASAWPLIVMGLFKKIVVADTLNSIVERVFSLQEPSKLLVLAATLGFTLQILADFSAYTDLSRGLAWLLGFETSENFRQPYLALTPSEFWNRWHITLSSFLRDYIFFPLRRALLKRKTLPGWLVQSVPPLVTMTVSGIWHGAGWTYLAWGIYYGVLIVAYQSAGVQGDWKSASGVKRGGAWLLMFSLIVFGWLLFRAPTLGWVGKVLFQFPWLGTSQDWVIILVVLSMVLAYAAPLVLKLLLDRSIKNDSWWHAAFYAALTITTVLYINSSNPDFIYFQF
jgi:D-alanyl-lipoteichoic acid acyltransferase DltB (MBOAT superfamily)